MPAAGATSRWRTPEDGRGANGAGVAGAGGLIGPNAILQLIPPVERALGPAGLAQLVAEAGLGALPDGRAMIPEGQAAALHRALRRLHPDLAPQLAAEAGARTAAYLLANRIPRAVQVVLRLLPAARAGRILAGAIARNAWTFAGSGRFRVVAPGLFEIEANPLIAGERSALPLCRWHAAVFETLHVALVAPDMRCIETRCGAQPGGGACRFALIRQGAATPPG